MWHVCWNIVLQRYPLFQKTDFHKKFLKWFMCLIYHSFFTGEFDVLAREAVSYKKMIFVSIFIQFLSLPFNHFCRRLSFFSWGWRQRYYKHRAYIAFTMLVSVYFVVSECITWHTGSHLRQLHCETATSDRNFEITGLERIFWELFYCNFILMFFSYLKKFERWFGFYGM